MTACLSSTCPALFISAPASNQGKTTITAGLARYHRRLGRRVRVFKTGPDFLDPMVLARACGAPVYSLDLWMVGETACQHLLADAARVADLILIEGVMGLFDGTPSSADLASRAGVPVMAIISAQAMAQTFSAIAWGLANFAPQLVFYGVFANRTGSARHAQVLQQALPSRLRWIGHLLSADEIELPNRHLGLFQASEIADLDARLERIADAIAQTMLIDLPPPVEFTSESSCVQARLLDGMHIAIARDDAFSFIYPANLDLLAALGAHLSYFSPLQDETAPGNADAIYLPGGYPELHANRLTQNTRTAASIHAHAAARKRIVAECGGMLYLLHTLTYPNGTTIPMLGLLPGQAVLQTCFAALGMQRLDGRHGALTGHTFHYAKMTTPLTPVLNAVHPQSGARGEALFHHGAIVATYMHGYWPSNPVFAAALFSDDAF